MEARINIKEQEDLFSLIGRTLKKRTEAYAVGGTAMMFLNLKETTKDVDLVFKNREDYENFREALFHLGASKPESKIINPTKISSMLTLGNARFDLFLEYLIHFKLTEGVISRVKEVHEFSNLIIKIVSPEDIILFKSFADRESDRIDVTDIIKKTNVNWDLVLAESEAQTKNAGYFFNVFLYEFIIGIKQDFNAEIPKEFMQKLKKANREALLAAEKRIKRKSI